MELSFGTLYQDGIEHQKADASPYSPTDTVDKCSIDDSLSIVAIIASSNMNDKTTLQQVRYETDYNVISDNEDLQKKTSHEPIFDKFVILLTTFYYVQRAVILVRKKKAEYMVEKN